MSASIEETKKDIVKDPKNEIENTQTENSKTQNLSELLDSIWFKHHGKNEVQLQQSIATVITCVRTSVLLSQEVLVENIKQYASENLYDMDVAALGGVNAVEFRDMITKLDDMVGNKKKIK